NAPPTLKDPKFWTDEEKKTRKIDRLARSLLIQDRKATILYEYKTFKAIEGEQLLDTYLRYLQVINDLNNKQKEKVVVSSDSEGSGGDDFSKLKKITTLLAKAFNRRKFYSKPTNNNLRTSSTSQFANKKQEFVKTDDKKEDKKADEKKRDMSKVKCYNCKKEGHFSKDCKTNLGWSPVFANKKQELVKTDDKKEDKKADEKKRDMSKVKCYNCKKEGHFSKDCKTNLGWSPVVILIRKSMQTWSLWLKLKRFFQNKMKVLHLLKKPLLRKQIADQEVLFDKMSVELVELDKHVRDLKNTVLKNDFKISELKECVRNKDLEIEKCIGFENPSYFEKAKDLRPTLYDEKVIGLGYTLMFLTHSNEALEIEKFKRSRENKIKFAYDYRNLNASYVNEKINFEDDYFQEIINLDFKKTDSPFQQISSLKPYVSNVILEKIIIDLEDVVTLLVVLEDLNIAVLFGRKKGSSDTFNVDLSAVSHSNLNKNVKRYSRKDLLACNNSHLGETSSAYVCNDTVNVSCNPRICDLLDDNNFFIFDDESVRISLVSKIPFKKKPRDSMNVRSKSTMINLYLELCISGFLKCNR
nr:hypothetical protein [Tanacetum cinerariifolium]